MVRLDVQILRAFRVSILSTMIPTLD